MLGNAAHIFCDGHAVVIKDNQHPFAAVSGVREALIGQAARQSAVSDEGNYIVILSQKCPGSGHAGGHGHGVGRMAGNKRITAALYRLGKSSHTAERTQTGHLVRSSSENFMGITLVPHIKDKPVPSEVEYPVKGYRDLHRP